MQDDPLRELKAMVDKFGWAAAAQCSCYGGPPYVYTIGLPYNLVLSGIDPDVGFVILQNAVTYMQRESIRPEPGMLLPEILDDAQVRLDLVSPARAPGILRHAFTFNKRYLPEQAPPTTLQLMWPDASHRLPGDGMSQEDETLQTLVYDMVTHAEKEGGRATAH